MRSKRIDDATKQKVIEAHASGRSRKEIAEQFGISPSSVSRITKGSASPKSYKKAMKPKKQNERQKKIANLEKRLLQLEKKILDLEAKKAAGRCC